MWNENRKTAVLQHGTRSSGLDLLLDAISERLGRGDTLARFPQAVDYWSSVHGPSKDLAWFQERFSSGPLEAQMSSEYQHTPRALKETPFATHAMAMALHNARLWQAARGTFERSAKLRKSDQAFDWLWMAMDSWHLKDAEAADRWYKMAVSSTTKEEASVELIALGREARRLLNSNPDREEPDRDD